VPSAKPILDAMRTALFKEGRGEREILRDLTAFTHPRRLAILSCLLKRKDATAETLAAATHVSQPAMSRHLKKLLARGLVRLDGDRWSLVPCAHHPARALLAWLAPPADSVSPPRIHTS
jgi:hypothetical protein